MGFFRKKKKAVVVEKTPIQKLNDEIKTHTATVDKLERLKPRLNKLVEHYKKQLDPYSRVYESGVTLSFLKEIGNYPDGFYAFADKLGLNVEPSCSRYYSNEEKSFVVRAKSK